ncbi:AFL140Wp [Eremothecium gossypii ATCC 10895]|uniref:AFL140Wp n=1 Tax=Eremothecium gossypii (strain ATCC 10895 / CBS 109.51 / FGSC 9923 / NRRL Y-1056) TaxID=284811 RepID=Q755G3_EREGS|nr:AFL140Wp [Eremothecium gossypii ATCC 10895]AAS53234.1 AFL140Wp [Eremothecium gossypii ATCC 10895]AEY97544.1 FAFL140Wp [Eremothecium gossypii FDAG1]
MPAEKLELTSEEIKHIHLQLKGILDEKIRLHLPQRHSVSESQDTDDGSDSMARQVMVEVEKFLSSVMEMASDSVHVSDARSSVTVLDVVNDVQREYVEPFDLELNERVRQLYQEWEAETLRVAQLRQTGPRAITDAYLKEEGAAIAALDERIRKLEGLAEADQETQLPAADADFWSEVGDQYGRSLGLLKQAQSLLPRDRMQLEKLKKLVQYLENEV